MSVVGGRRETCDQRGDGLQDSSAVAGRRSGCLGARRSILGTAADAQRLRAEIGREPPDERAVEMGEAKDTAAAYARAALEQVDSAATLIAVGGQLRVPEDPEFGH